MMLFLVNVSMQIKNPRVNFPVTVCTDHYAFARLFQYLGNSLVRSRTHIETLLFRIDVMEVQTIYVCLITATTAT
jgi:hypothetical protein